MKKLLTGTCILLSIISLQAQFTYNESELLTIPKAGEIALDKEYVDFAPYLYNVEAITPGGSSYRSFLATQKAKIPTFKYTVSQQQAKTSGITDPPNLLRNFNGNPFGGVPCDNDMAISNDGVLISVINSNIWMYDTEADTLIRSISLESFTDPGLNITAHKFDPKVIYDPKQDKFIIVYLAGNSSTTNSIVVAFSQSNDVKGTWHQYEIPGNPNMDNTWSDYPIVAMTDDEFFLTVNLIQDDSSWQAGFTESICWQIRKNDGYGGQSLTSKMWSGFKFSGKSVRNLCPIQGGISTTGPGIYLLSNRNFDMENDTIFIMEITGDLNDASASLEIDLRTSNVKYGMPPEAQQPLNRKLQTNDARILGGFIQNDEIHFVGNTIDPVSMNAAVYHGVIEDVFGAKWLKGYILSDPDLDYGYPNISFSGRNANDMQAILSFNHSSADSNPGTSAIFFEKFVLHSDRTHIYSGNSFVDLIGGTQRWGDYSGSQRKYDEPGIVWMSGFYGFKQNSFTEANRTWIAELESPGSNPVGIQENNTPNHGKVYPNPAYEFVQVEFNNPESQWLFVRLYNTNGQMIKELISQKAKKGSSIFKFNTLPLVPATYILSIETENGGSIFTEKLLIK